MESVNTSETPSTREGDQASYFYVVWPEETVTTVSATGSLEQCQSPHRQIGPQTHHQHNHSHHQHRQNGHQEQREPEQHQQSSTVSPVSEMEIATISVPRSIPSPVLSVAGHSQVQISAAVQTQPQSSAAMPPERSSTGYGAQVEAKHTGGQSNHSSHSQGSSESASVSSSQPTSPLSNSLPTSVGAVGAMSNGMGGVHSEGHSPMDQDSVAHSRKRAKVQYYDINGCLECEVKDAEIKTLRRRIQVMEEVVALLNQRVNSLQQNSNMLFSQMVMPPIVSQVMIPTSVKNHLGNHQEGNSPNVVATSPRLSDNEDGGGEHAGIAYAQPELCPPTEHRVELVPGSGVYLSLARREEARREAKNGTQLARKLMDAFWDRDTLARASLSSKSKFQYQQLDPKVINAIEAFCLAFDANTHSRDLHACMTDKCCQARSRRGSFRVTGLPNSLQNGMNT